MSLQGLLLFLSVIAFALITIAAAIAAGRLRV